MVDRSNDVLREELVEAGADPVKLEALHKAALILFLLTPKFPFC